MTLISAGKDLFSEKVLGEGVRGGGEYLEFSSAFDESKKAANFFTQAYATGSTQAFNRLDTTDIGGTLCNAFVSGNFPSAASLVDNVGRLDSPVQFYGKFEERSFNTATNPPTSYYSVTYHIYAGENRGGNYQVYLKDGGGSSYYQDTRSKRVVKSGYIPAGEAATEKIDFQDVSGYDELCIRVNDFQECGFKSVTTDFGMNYLTDQYVKSQVEDTNIETEEQCISGTKSAYSLINPNLQSGVTNALNPEISNYNIIRVCATSSPGQGSDDLWNVQEKAKWRQVGYCGNENLGCWLDTESIEEVFNWDATLDDSLVEVNEYYNAVLANQSITDEEFEAFEYTINSNFINKKYDKVIAYITEILGESKIFFDFQKAQLYFLRGNAYRELAIDLLRAKKIDEAKVPDFPEEKENFEDYLPQEIDLGFGSSESEFIVFEFEKGLKYSYWDGEWHYSEEGKNWKSVFESEEGLSTLDSNLVIFLFRSETVEEGLEVLLSMVGSERLGKLSSKQIEFDGQIFKIDGLRISYKFEDGIWKWNGPIDSEWRSVVENKDIVYERREFEGSGDLEREVINEYTFSLEDGEKSLFGDLEGKNFVDGALVIFSLDKTSTQVFSIESLAAKYGEDVLKKIEGKTECEECKRNIFGVGCNEEQCNALSDLLSFDCQWISVGGAPDRCITVSSLFEDRSEIDHSSQNWQYSQILTAIRNAGTSAVNQDCEKYISLAIDASEKYEIDDPLLLITMMQHESNCDPNAVGKNGMDTGLMQINAGAHCGSHELSKNLDDCKKELLDPRTNIFTGAKILREAYDWWVKEGKPAFNKCGRNVQYIDWEAALRRYNGWGCGNEYYVERVMEEYDFLVSNVERTAITGSSSVGASSRIVESALKEYDRWGKCTVKECSSRGEDILELYWNGVGWSSFDCKDDPWSAAFISYVMEEAEVRDFPSSAGHARYFSKIRDTTTSCSTNKISKIDSIVKGNLLCLSRTGSKINYEDFSDQIGHCDVVLESANGNLVLVGGNVGDTEW